MKHILRAQFLLFLLSLPQFSYGGEGDNDSTRHARWFVPHFIPLQFAGNIGMVSAGIGYNSHKHPYQLSLFYGYVPMTSRSAAIHTVTAKNSFALHHHPIRNSRTLIPYAGVAISVEVGGTSFLVQPASFPKSYYDFPKALHATGFAGVRVHEEFRDRRFLRGAEFYAEANTLDIYLFYKVTSEHVRMRQIFSLALGVNLLLYR